MMLQYFVPVAPKQLETLFLIEAVLILLNMILFAWLLVVTFKVQIHTNLKIIGLSTMAQYYFSLFSRLVLLSLESGFFLAALPENHWLVYLLSCLRNYHMCLVLSMPLWLYIERRLAIYYIQDYEKNQRRWISFILITVSTLYSCYGGVSFTLDWTPWQLTLLLGLLIGVIGCLLFFRLKRKAAILYEEMNNDHRTAQLPYSLSCRFQLIENKKATTVICHAIVGLALINVVGVFLFLIVHLEISNKWFGPATVQLLDVVFNLYVTINGPIITLAMLMRNEDAAKVVKVMIFGEKVNPVNEVDDGHVYFMQLKEQWDNEIKK